MIFFNVIAACNGEIDRPRAVVPGGSISVCLIHGGIYLYCSKSQENMLNGERVKVFIIILLMKSLINFICIFFF
jgi:hypothetical protein